MSASLQPPLALLAEVTHRCPMRCVYCSNPLVLEPRSAELDTATWCRVLDEAAALGCLHVHFSGGEPTARGDLPKLVEQASAAGLYVNLITSGVMLDAGTLAPQGQFQYSTEGWGMTHDGQRLIVSDGTPTIQFWDPATLQQTGGIYVSMFGLPISQINELEYFDDAIWANVWQTNLVVRIDPKTGLVNGVVDFTGLLDYAPPAQKPTDVLNGIAYDEATGRLFVTGKWWPAVFEIELVEVKQ